MKANRMDFEIHTLVRHVQPVKKWEQGCTCFQTQTYLQIQIRSFLPYVGDFSYFSSPEILDKNIEKSVNLISTHHWKFGIKACFFFHDLQA